MCVFSIIAQMFSNYFTEVCNNVFYVFATMDSAFELHWKVDGVPNVIASNPVHTSGQMSAAIQLSKLNLPVT